MNIADLFRERPDTWSLRGDPHLWDEMEESFRQIPVPADTGTLEKLLQQSFENFAGVPITYDREHVVERYDKGGVSSGVILPTFWRNEIVPMILGRAVVAREAYAGNVTELLAQAKKLAREYRRLTGRPLGITGEVAEFSAAQALGLRLASAREAGFDAVRYVDGREIRVQIKGRCLAEGAKRGQRVGGIKLNQPWDVVVLVLLTDEFEPLAMYEAGRKEVVQALTAPGSRARNERGALSVEKFRSISTLVWKSPSEGPYS